MQQIYICAEHCGINLKKYLIQNSTLPIIDLYEVEDQDDDYPDVAKIMAQKLMNEPDSFGIVICGSGQGIAMAINRSNFVRCAVPRNEQEAMTTRDHNNANCISFGAQNIDKNEAIKIILAFVNTPFSSLERHGRRVKKLSQKID